MNTPISASQAATDHGIPLRTIQEACKRGRLPANRFGGNNAFLIDPADAARFAETWHRRADRKGNTNGDRTQD